MSSYSLLYSTWEAGNPAAIMQSNLTSYDNDPEFRDFLALDSTMVTSRFLIISHI